MTEILTESFCERCGTRYTFESARPRVRLKGVKVLSRGLKNFVLSDDTSMDEAMAAARSETDRESTAHQLDAFHKTFNFCMSCRQYTCPNCWNDTEARCLTCAPLALQEVPATLDDLGAFRAALIGEPAAGNGTFEHEHDTLAATAEVATEANQGMAPVENEIESAAATASGLEPSTAPGEQEAAAVDPASKAAAQTTGLLRRFRPGQNLDAELDAFERKRGDPTTGDVADQGAGDADTVGAPETAPAAAAEPIVADAVIADAVIAEPQVEPADIGAPEPELQPRVAASGADVVEQPTWRVTAPDAWATTPRVGGDAGAPLQADAGTAPDAPTDGEPQWPTRPQWPSATQAAGLPFLGRPATPEGGIEALWAASNQELATAAPAPQGRAASGIQPCISCGLSLSATARFCRRCGTLQGG